MSRRFVLGWILIGLGAAGCGAHSPVAPDTTATTTTTQPSIPSNLRGVWHGYVTGRTCDAYPIEYCSPMTMRPFTLRAVESGAGFAGSFEIQTPNTPTPTTVFDVTGTSQADGSVSFTGSRSGIYNTTFTVSALRFKVSNAVGLEGDVDLRMNYSTEFVHTGSLSGTIVSAWYQPLEPALLSGIWTGVAKITSCDSYCRDGVGSSSRIEMTTDGATATGTFNMEGLVDWIPVSGTSNGATFSVASAVVQYTSGETRSVERFDGAVDGLGRVASGTVVIRGTRKPSLASAPQPFRITFEIQWLVRP